MALTEATFLQNPAQAQAANLLGPGLNMLSTALNNAVESGRRMVDLQSHQEDIFLNEREKLRLATERKGLEAQRIFEADRTFGEGVLRDRRNFAQDMFRDQRDFGLKSEIERGQLGLAQTASNLNERRFGLEERRVGIEEEKADAYGAFYDAKASDIRAGGTGTGRRAAFKESDPMALSVMDAYRDAGNILPMEGGLVLGGNKPNAFVTKEEIRMKEQDNKAAAIFQPIIENWTQDEAKDAISDPLLQPEFRGWIQRNLGKFKTNPNPASLRQKRWNPKNSIANPGFGLGINEGTGLLPPIDYPED